MGEISIYGKRPVMEALESGAPLHKIALAHVRETGNVRDLLALAASKDIPVTYLSRPELDGICQTDKHQGVVAWMPDVKYADLDRVLDDHSRNHPQQKPVLLLLDGVEDPRNLGAIIRVADCTGMTGVVITKRRCAEVTAAAIKTSAGAAFHVPIIQVTNLARLIQELQQRSFWIAGLEAESGSSIYDLDASLAWAIVLGREGQGLHRLVREKCDFLVKIPLKGKVDSLNVATAAAVVSYEIVRKREFIAPSGDS